MKSQQSIAAIFSIMLFQALYTLISRCTQVLVLSLEYTFMIAYFLTYIKIKMSNENPTFSRILVAVDGSELSLDAAEKALDLARLFNANLYAITVSYIPESYHLKQEDILNKSKNKESMTDTKTWLDNFMQTAKEYNVILKTELINSHRPVDYVIMEYAEQEKIDLIVMGTRGRSGLKDLLLGSVASSVITYAHCPVMVVK